MTSYFSLDYLLKSVSGGYYDPPSPEEETTEELSPLPTSLEQFQTSSASSPFAAVILVKPDDLESVLSRFTPPTNPPETESSAPAVPKETGDQIASFFHHLATSYLFKDLNQRSIGSKLILLGLKKMKDEAGPRIARLLPKKLPGYKEQRYRILAGLDTSSRFLSDLRTGAMVGGTTCLTETQKTVLLTRFFARKAPTLKLDDEFIGLTFSCIDLLLEKRTLFSLIHNLISGRYQLSKQYLASMPEVDDPKFVGELQPVLRALLANIFEIGKPTALQKGGLKAANLFGQVITHAQATDIDGLFRLLLRANTFAHKLKLAEYFLWNERGERTLDNDKITKKELADLICRQVSSNLKDYLKEADWLTSKVIDVQEIEKLVRRIIMEMLAIIENPALMQNYFYRYLLPTL